MDKDRRNELIFFLRHRLLQTWVSYVLLIAIFMLFVDYIRGTTQNLKFYFATISSLSFLMSCFELIFFRKVFIAHAEDHLRILSRMQMLHFEKKGMISPLRSLYVVKGRKFFTRANEMTIKESNDHLLINVNIFHWRHFKRFAVD